MSCGIVDRRSVGASPTGCRLRTSSSNLSSSLKSNQGNNGGSQTLAMKQTPSSTTGSLLRAANPNQNNSSAIQLRSSKPCCLCWCCCCSCSCLMRASDENNASKSINQKDLKNHEGESPPTIDEVRSWGTSFDKLMKSSAGRKVFRDFLKCEYSEENILFWLACEELKKESNPDAIEEKARYIYEDYISILSPQEVSLDSRVREIVNKNMTEPTPHTFDEAQLQIYTLMHRDSYPRFLNSPFYKKLAQMTSTGSISDGSQAGANGNAQNGNTDSRLNTQPSSAKNKTKKKVDKSENDTSVTSVEAEDDVKKVDQQKQLLDILIADEVISNNHTIKEAPALNKSPQMDAKPSSDGTSQIDENHHQLTADSTNLDQISNKDELSIGDNDQSSTSNDESHHLLIMDDDDGQYSTIKKSPMIVNDQKKIAHDHQSIITQSEHSAQKLSTTTATTTNQTECFNQSQIRATNNVHEQQLATHAAESIDDQTREKY